MSTPASFSQPWISMLAAAGASTPQSVSGARPSSQSSKTQQAGTDFEAILLTQWLGEAQSSFASVPTADDDDQDGDQLKSLGVQAMAQTLSRADVLGIAGLVTKALDQRAGTAAPGSSVGLLGTNSAFLKGTHP